MKQNLIIEIYLLLLLKINYVMKKIIVVSFFLISIVYFPSYAQPLITGETTTKVFSEDFSDLSKSFPTTSSKNKKFWGVYGDGYYFMERK